jgi:outer membrane protein
VGAELPIFSGGVVSARIRETESALRQAGLRLGNARRLAAQDIIDSYQSWETSAQEVEAYRRALLAARENYQATLGDYRYNLVTVLDVITSLTSLQGAQDDYDRVLLQHRLNRVRLGIATGEFSGDGVRVLRRKDGSTGVKAER